MTEYNSQVGGGKYCIQYETDNRENYREVEELIRRQIDGKPPAELWIPCSSGRMPEHEQHVFITLELIKVRRYTTAATYYTKTGVVDDYEWTGEGFYSYDSEYGYGKHENVIAWMPAEPYQEAME